MKRVAIMVLVTALYARGAGQNNPSIALPVMPDLPALPQPPAVAEVKIQATPTPPEKTDIKLAPKEEVQVLVKNMEPKEPEIQVTPSGQEIKVEVAAPQHQEITVATADDSDDEMNKLISSLAKKAMKKVNEKAQKHLEESIKKAIDKAIDELATKVAGI
jgi:hypothetical protein